LVRPAALARRAPPELPAPLVLVVSELEHPALVRLALMPRVPRAPAASAREPRAQPVRARLDRQGHPAARRVRVLARALMRLARQAERREPQVARQAERLVPEPALVQAPEAGAQVVPAAAQVVATPSK
jgi:hypothetical protein